MDAEPIELRRDFVQNPHELYATLRSRGPVHLVSFRRSLRMWLVTDYDVARELLNDPRLSKDNALAMSLFPPGTAGANASVLGANMLHLDPPAHTRIRGLVAKAFTARAIARLRPSIEKRVDELLDALPTGAGPVDFIPAFALPLPISVIGMMLGVPDADRAMLAQWTTPFVSESTPDELQHAERATVDYLTRLIAAKRAEPGEDILSGLVQAAEDDDTLSADELLTTTFLLILAGFETTVHLFASGLNALLRAPDQLALLRSRPDLLPRAIEELLRYESPLNCATDRVTTEPIRIGEVEIPKHQFVKIALLSANHDGSQFPGDADRLDITRDNAGTHLAFGHGIHFCLGAPLARLEGEIGFGRLLARFPSIALDETAIPTYRNSILIRGLTALPVVFDV
ncbi:MAG TPA: cytochrome P450 [Pseudonocardiaceae bacterium]|jgi:cytochrome P450